MNWKPATFGSALMILTAALVFGRCENVAAQRYYYQPHPDYYHNDTAAGTVTGGAVGAVAGAIIAGKKDREEGALIGAGVGALTGNMLGRSKDRADHRRAAHGAAMTARANQEAAARAITDYDLVSMTRAGISDDVIISTIRARGARLDLSPEAIISLKESGVSDDVLLAAQEMNMGPAYVQAPPPPVVHHGPYRQYRYRPRYSRYRSRVYYSEP
ncbi:MAG TPA: YMGG-like glycine zipper-containing protein [Lacipirellulaceae bacterium]